MKIAVVNNRIVSLFGSPRPIYHSFISKSRETINQMKRTVSTQGTTLPPDGLSPSSTLMCRTASTSLSSPAAKLTAWANRINELLITMSFTSCIF